MVRGLESRYFNLGSGAGSGTIGKLSEDLIAILRIKDASGSGGFSLLDLA